MPNRNYVLGRALEYRRKKHWEAEGWTVLRTAGSHGFADLILTDPKCVPIFLQIKRCRTVAEAKRLCTLFRKTTKPAAYYCQMLECHVPGEKALFGTYIDCTGL